MQKRIFSPGNYALRVRRSKTGYGLFTEQPIPKSACIIEYIGKPATPAQQKANTGKYLFWTSDTTMIDGNIPANKARFVNHGCQPNCEIDIKDKRVFVFAKKNIGAGQELNYDYGEEYFNMHFKAKGCCCATCEQKAKKY